MSSQRKSSPISSIVDLSDPPVQGLRATWHSPIGKPKPKKLIRQFNHAAKIDSSKTCVPNENEECSADSEGEAFSSFAADWAKEDKTRNLQLDNLEALEDCMETTMHLADQIVRLITKFKKSIKNY